MLNPHLYNHRLTSCATRAIYYFLTAPKFNFQCSLNYFWESPCSLLNCWVAPKLHVFSSAPCSPDFLFFSPLPNLVPLPSCSLDFFMDHAPSSPLFCPDSPGSLKPHPWARYSMKSPSQHHHIGLPPFHTAFTS